MLGIFKNTCYGLGKNSQNQQLLDVLACKDGLLPELQDRMSRIADFCFFSLTHSRRP